MLVLGLVVLGWVLLSALAGLSTASVRRQLPVRQLRR
jgi:hypothetical protein